MRTVVLALGIAIFKPCHRKVCFQSGKKVKFVATTRLRGHPCLTMQSSSSFLFQVCLSLLLSMGSCTCKPLSGNSIQGKELAELRSQLEEQEDLLEEEDNEARVENLLGTMKEGFLRKLNLSDIPQEHSKIDPPQFMMELYDKYASDSSAIPQSDVIRSFTVQGTESKMWKPSADMILSLITVSDYLIL